ncbi:hypothetical protein CGC49_05130 [Capnocytophaga sp. H4358]|uniref:hypothetical protein n=1 Tax=Capnocytophaga TaxID=1016 RepID=UPI000BB1CF8E|nr:MULTISPECIES: hypothetical protein [Capnocytophaga]ATA72730.1 hypothetical protein CGC49_05130 [Capnocytophaga sp. H4358]
MIYKIIFSLVVSVSVCSIFTVLFYQFLLWLNPPYVIVDGQIRYTMPLGTVIFSLLFGVIVAIVTFILCLWKLKRQN